MPGKFVPEEHPRDLLRKTKSTERKKNLMRMATGEIQCMSEVSF